MIWTELGNFLRIKFSVVSAEIKSKSIESRHSIKRPLSMSSAERLIS